jgi:hypothetical protein
MAWEESGKVVRGVSEAAFLLLKAAQFVVRDFVASALGRSLPSSSACCVFLWCSTSLPWSSPTSPYMKDDGSWAQSSY